MTTTAIAEMPDPDVVNDIWRGYSEEALLVYLGEKTFDALTDWMRGQGVALDQSKGYKSIVYFEGDVYRFFEGGHS